MTLSDNCESHQNECRSLVSAAINGTMTLMQTEGNGEAYCSCYLQPRSPEVTDKSRLKD